MPKQPGVEAVDRALTLLLAFHEPNEALSLSALAERSGFYKSTILRLMASLERYGMVRRGSDGRFRLGPSAARLGSIAPVENAIEARVRQVLARLVEETGETASFYVRHGASRLCLYRLNSPRAARHHLEEGQVLPMDRGAAAHVLRAWNGENDPIAEETRRAGFSISRGERDAEIHAIAAPVFGMSGQFEGALAISGLNTRLDNEAMEAARLCLMREAAALTAALGARTPGLAA